MSESAKADVRWVGLLWLPWLVALQSIPGTGAWRTLFLLAGIAHVALLARRCRRPQWPAGAAEALWLGLLTAWLVAQAALVSPTPAASLAALSGEWSKLLLMAGLGLLLGAYARHAGAGAGWPAIGLFLGYFVHVVSTLGYQAWTYLRHGALMPGDSFLGNYGYASPFVTGALAFLLAEAVVRLRGQRWLPLSNAALWLAIFATLAAQALLRAKASIIVAAALFLVAALATATITRLRRQSLVFLAGGLIAIAASLMVSNRWQGAAEAIATAFDGPTNFQVFKESDDPLAFTNRPDESVSFYVRAVSARIGFAGIAAHPLGLGYGADAFGRYLAQQGGAPGAISSESGWIDFALGNGIPGLLLLLGLFWTLMRRGWLAFRAGQPAGLAALLVTLNFVARSVLDGHLAGSRLTGFAFVAAALWMLAARPGAQPHASRPG